MEIRGDCKNMYKKVGQQTSMGQKTLLSLLWEVPSQNIKTPAEEAHGDE